MTIAVEPSQIATPTPAHAPAAKRPLRSFGRRLRLSLRTLAAGMRASKDYRFLNGMSDRQLGELGLTRDEIPRELHRRHFAGLTSALGKAD